MAVPTPTAAEIDSVPQVRFPARVEVPLTASVTVPAQNTEPSSQWLLDVPLKAIWPVADDGVKSSWFQQERSPVGHQLEAPRQETSGPAVGSWEQGAANQL